MISASQIPSFRQRPDWVIIGTVTDTERFMVLASDQMTYGQLHSTMESKLGENWLEQWNNIENRNWTFQANFGRFMWAVGDSYQDALLRLFEQWAPKAGELEAGKAEIDGKRN